MQSPRVKSPRLSFFLRVPSTRLDNFSKQHCDGLSCDSCRAPAEQVVAFDARQEAQQRHVSLQDPVRFSLHGRKGPSCSDSDD